MHNHYVMKHVNLRQLEVFRAVIKAESISQAAVQLNVTQPAVSRAVAMLEDEIGFKLFHRSRGRVHPSTDAQVLDSEVERLFQQIESLRDSVERVRDAQEGRLMVSAVPSLAGSFVGFAIGRFLRERPRIRPELYSRISGQAVEDVVHHRVDLGFIHAPAKDAGVNQKIVGESEIVCIMHRDHPLAGVELLTPRELVDQALVFLDKQAPPSHLVREAFAASGVQPRISVEVNLSAAAKAVASAGSAIAMIDPLTMLGERSPHLVIRHFRPRIPLRIFCISSPTRPLSHAAQAFVQDIRLTIRSYAKDHSYIRSRSA